MTSLLLAVLLWICCVMPADAATYGISRSSTPVLNSPAFSSVFGGHDGTTLKTDRCGQVRELEYIALPGTVFTIVDETQSGGIRVFRVKTDDYQPPAGTKLYVDSRSIEIRPEQPPRRLRTLPPLAEVIAALKGSIGSPYVWGGNLREGLPETAGLYYNAAALSAGGRARLTLAGLDCSGLLYQATGGWTPRNTSQLVSYGAGLRVAGKGPDEIAGMLEPLDLIVWNGHVVIVLDRDTVIESRLECGRQGNGGVVTTPLRKRLEGIMRTRRPLDSWPAAGKHHDVIVVRRWYGM